MTRQAWVTLPNCLASSNRPTLALITLRSVVVIARPLVQPAGALRFAYGYAPRPLSPPKLSVRQIKSRLRAQSHRERQSARAFVREHLQIHAAPGRRGILPPW